MSKRGHSPLSALLHSERHAARIGIEHIPLGDVFDDRAGYQFYVHSHRSANEELAHAHVFFHATATGRRRKAIPWGKQSPSHLIAISFADNGWPKGLFIPNLWVTDGFWLNSNVISKRIESMDLSTVPKKHRVLSRFIQGLLQLCTPEIQALLAQRDALIAKATAKLPLIDVLNDERWEVLCHIDIDFLAIVDRIENACDARNIH